MEKKQMYAAVAAIVIIVAVVAVAVWYMGNDNGGSNEPGETGDKYYVYLDGTDEISGWYIGTGANADEAFKGALDEAGISYNIDGGWIKSIGDYVAADNYSFGTYVYTANTTENAYAGYFGTGPVLSEINSNIVYIAYTEYEYDFETETTNYHLNPLKTTSDFMSTGPFADKNYKPLTYSTTYNIYLDGTGNISGWYTATGANAAEAFMNALDEAGISYNLDGGWIKSIGDYVAVDNYSFGSYVYTANTTDNAYDGYFAQGPVLTEVAGNIVYLGFTEYLYDSETGLTTYYLNPTSTEAGFMSEGPFATA